MAYTEQEARTLVVEAGRRLLERGLVARTWGNISARISEHRFVITPSGLAYETMTPDQLVVVDGRDGSYEGALRPSSERGIHADAYRLRGGVNFVIHTHQDMASVYGVAGRELATDHPLLGGCVPCAAYALPSTRQLRRAVAAQVRARPDSPAIFLRSHGALCLGRNMEDAFAVSAALEEVCARRVASAVGPPELPPYVPDLGESWRVGDAFWLRQGGTERLCPLGGADRAAAFHTALYRALDGAGAILHLTDPDVVAVSMSGRPLRPLLDDLAQIAGTELVCLTACGLSEILRGLRRHGAVLLRGAGALCAGSSREEAQAAAWLLRKGCLARRFAQAVPGCRPLRREDAALQRLFYVTKYAKRKTGGSEPWGRS